MKKCIECKIEKELEKFSFRKDSNSYRKICKLCRSKSEAKRTTEPKIRENRKNYAKEYYNKNKDIFKQKFKEYYSKNNKHLNTLSKLYRSVNRQKLIEYNRKYNEINKIKLADQNKKYYITNKNSKLTYNKIYRINNKEKINVVKYAYRKKLYNTDPAFKIRINVSRLINIMLNGEKGGKSILKYLPYTMIQLKQHIELQFDSWMNWNNWGVYNSKIWDDQDPATWTWQLDHIIPQSKLLYTSMEDDNFKKCCGLENLRPYSAKQNILGGNRRSYEDYTIY